MTTNQSIPVYYFYLKTDNVYHFCGSTFFSYLASYQNRAAGFVRKDRVYNLLAELRGKLQFDGKINMVSSERFWKDYDKYHAIL